MKLKGIVLVIIVHLVSIMMPFSVYASVQSQIVPTFSSTTSQWNGHLYITNFSDGTNNQASSTLSFTFDDDYYGIIYFDGYGPSNQHIANYASCFIAGGYGEYRYSYYQNGIINITNVTINIINVVKPDSNVDLTQIIQLLTAIENDTNSIDNVLDTTLAQIRLVLAELIESNGYLETLTKLRQWNFPIESFSAISNNLHLEIVGFTGLSYWTYPQFKVTNGQYVFNHLWNNANKDITIVMILKGNDAIDSISRFNNQFSYNSRYSIKDFQFISYTDNLGSLFKIVFSASASGYFELVALSDITYVIPIFYGNNISNISTDFALNFGLSNQLLDDIHLIAQGSNQSNSSASDLESSNDQMADDMDDLATIESGYNQQFNNQLQSIDFTSPMQNNAGILPAANFVISIFNGLINNNPFSVLIIVVCILLIGKKVIGK